MTRENGRGGIGPKSNGRGETTRGFIDDRRRIESVALPSEPLWFEADPTPITQVVGALLDNAVKYTPRGGAISVTGYSERGEVVLHVRDTGIGIAPEMLRPVFDLFVQADRALAGSDAGLGVGLTLARTLIELHGGTIIALRGRAGGASSSYVCPSARRLGPGGATSWPPPRRSPSSTSGSLVSTATRSAGASAPRSGAGCFSWP
jgi:signal transduction histidine kinase